MSVKPFRFKAFEVYHDRCAMKIGTAGVLLGSWVEVSSNPFSVLDIGAGTGVLALMMAQRTSAQVIDAMEIEPDAYEQCVENFERSPWNDRLFCYHADFTEFAEEIDDQYELIISNPPFFTEATASSDLKRDQARRSASLPFSDLLLGVSKLLSSQGQFNTIVPYKEHHNFITLAKDLGLFPCRMTFVKGTPDSDIKMVLLAFSFAETTIRINELTIELKRHQYTEDYINLTKDFYLHM